MLERRARVKELVESRQLALHTSLLVAAFIRAATQVKPIPAQCHQHGPHLPVPDDVHLRSLFRPRHSPVMRTLKFGS